ncbi:MAG: ABC transporter transmembrane domain-containing protein [Saprospiraceae bacterium]
MTLSQIEKLHLRQQDQSDCGVACLLMALKYHGGSASMERLREVSGTTKTGTTLLGLIQGGAQVGLHGEGFSAEIIHLQECTDLCVLHVIKDDVMQHFILCYGWDAVRQKFLISDSASGHPEYMDAASLEKIWKTRSLVLFKPTEKIVKTKESSYQKWQWFQQVIRPDTNILLTAMAIGIVVAVTGLSTAIFSQRLLDDIIPSGDHLRLYSGLGLLLVLLLIRSFLSYIRSLFLIRQSKDFNTRITDIFYSSILHLPKSFFDHRKTGDLIARMTDTQRIQRTVSALFSSSIIDILMIVVSSVAIIIYHWQIGLISLAWLPVFTYIVYRFHRPILTGQEKVMQAYARSESHLY